MIEKLLDGLAAMQGRSVLTLSDLSDGEMRDLIDLSIELKRAKRENRGGTRRHLAERTVAMVFEKSSTRTRCATSVAVLDEGGAVEYLGKGDIHLGKKESVKDTARVLGRMFDGIMFRGYKHDTVTQLAQFSGVPVWNGLTESAHPTQALADLMTIREHFGCDASPRVVYVGDGRNNVANSLMLGCAKAGLDFVNCSPKSLWPARELVEVAEKRAAENGSCIELSDDPVSGVAGANVLYTDVWASMGEEAQMAERIALLQPFQVNADMVARTGMADSGQFLFLHCLPAFHNHETEASREVGAMEVTDEVFEAEYSRVFDQAENRMHTIKALIVATAGRRDV